jgi:hypothetical protein
MHLCFGTKQITVKCRKRRAIREIIGTLRSYKPPYTMPIYTHSRCEVGDKNKDFRRHSIILFGKSSDITSPKTITIY